MAALGKGLVALAEGARLAIVDTAGQVVREVPLTSTTVELVASPDGRYLASSDTRGRVEVTARSALHDTRVVWSSVSGELTVDPADAAGGAGEVRVDMRVFDAGDRLKTWKIKSDLDPDRHPQATFRLESVDQPQAGPTGASGTANGRLSWRGRETRIKATGRAWTEATRLVAEARFTLDVRLVGVTPPKVLLVSVDPIVDVTVRLEAEPTG